MEDIAIQELPLAQLDLILALLPTGIITLVQPTVLRAVHLELVFAHNAFAIQVMVAQVAMKLLVRNNKQKCNSFFLIKLIFFKK